MRTNGWVFKQVDLYTTRTVILIIEAEIEIWEYFVAEDNRSFENDTAFRKLPYDV